MSQPHSEAAAERRSPVSLVDRTLALLEILALADEPARLSDLAHRLEIPKSAAHRILSSLVENGWVEQSAESDCYGLTLRMALIGQRQLARLSTPNLHQPILDDLARRTKELVRLTAVQGAGLTWIGSARGRRSGLVYEPDISERILPFATANGKVWLATLPRDLALRIALESGLGRLGGPAALRGVEELSAELDRTAARGYGLAREEAEAGVGAVAVPVKGPHGLLGTMSVAAPITRLDAARIQELVPLLRRAAQDMALAWPGSLPETDPG